MQDKKRVYMLDILRGVAVIGMIVHHALVSYEIVFGNSISISGVYVLETEAFTVLQLIFVAVFLLISGICTNYSKNIIKRALIVCVAAVVVTVATCFVLPNFGMTGLEIYFGILHMFGLSMLLYGLAKKAQEKPIVGVVLFVVLFLLYYVLYRIQPVNDSYLYMLFGIVPDSIVAYGDYYPLFPYALLFFAGTYIGKYVKEGRFPDWFYNKRCKPLEFCGKYSLWVYILHQPIIFGLLYLISMIK